MRGGRPGVRNFKQVGRRLELIRLPLERREVHALTRPCQRDVEETAFLGVTALVAPAHVRWECAIRKEPRLGSACQARREASVDQRRHEDDRPLQPLGLVNGEHRYGVEVAGGLALEVLVGVAGIVEEVVVERAEVVAPAVAGRLESQTTVPVGHLPAPAEDVLEVAEHLREPRKGAHARRALRGVRVEAMRAEQVEETVEIREEIDGTCRARVPLAPVLEVGP